MDSNFKALPGSTVATPTAGSCNKMLVGLIGAGIQRSLTPSLHEEEARHHGLRLHYQLIDLDRDARGIDALPSLVHAARTMDFAGLNITYPCKQAVIGLLDDLAPEARSMGAVNTVVHRDGRMIGHNTDGSGWRWGFEQTLPGADAGKVVLLGAGGAGSAIAHAVLGMHKGELVLVDQDPARAQSLAAELRPLFPGRVRAEVEIGVALQGATGLIHATPTGMDKLPGLPLDEALLHPGIWVAEIVYFPLETALLKAARARGCAVVDGGTMAVGQALGAFELITGLKPDPDRMKAHFRKLIGIRGHA